MHFLLSFSHLHKIICERSHTHAGKHFLQCTAVVPWIRKANGEVEHFLAGFGPHTPMSNVAQHAPVIMGAESLENK